MKLKALPILQQFSGEGESTSSSSGGSGSIEVSAERDLWADLQSDLEELIKNECIEFKDNLSQNSSDAAPAAAEGGGDCGYVRINRTVGLVQMKAPQTVLDSAEEVIRRVEDIASRRLLVEARIIAVSKDHTFEKGGNISGKAGEFVGGTHGGKNELNVASELSKAILGGFSNESAFGSSLGFIGNDLKAAVRYAESFGTTYQLMKPTIEVMDRQRAVMIDGRNEVYFIGTREDDDDPDTTDPVTYSDKYQFCGYSVLCCCSNW